MPQDVSQLSDAQLLAIVGQPQSQTAPRPQAAGRPSSRAPQAYTGPLPTDPSQVFPHLVMQESGGRAGVLGPQTRYGQAQGRTQMLPETARATARRLGVPWQPEMMTGTTPEAAAYQDRLGLAYLEEGLQNTGNMRDALRYYHGGPNRALWGPKTNAYAEEVLGRMGSGAAAPAPVRAASAPDVSALPDDQLLALATGQQNQPVQAQPEPSRPRGGPGIVDALRKPWLLREPERIVPLPPAEYDEQGNEIVQINVGVRRNPDGTFSVPEPMADGSSKVYRLNADEFARWESQRDNAHELNAEEQARRQDPAYQAEYAAARARAENVPAFLENLTQGGTLGAVPLIEGVLGYLDPNTDVSRGLASQAARDASRDRQATLLQNDPTGTIGAQLLGGLATPGLKGTGDWIGAGVGSQRLARAGVVGAGYGAAAGAIGGEGGLQERAGDALSGGLTGAGVGVVGQGALDRVLRPAAARAAAAGPSSARLLSREGVQLTPGQMLSDVPVVGPIARNLEEGASSIPFVGSPIAGARQQSVETFNRASINRALAPLDESLPRNIRPGYASVEYAQNRLGQAYDEVLPRVTAIPDQPFYDDIAQVIVRAGDELPQDRVDQLVRLVDNRVFRNRQGSTDPISGQTFKTIESELGALSREYAQSNDPANAALGRALDDTRQVVRDLIARQNPEEAARIARINEGYANLVRVEGAAGSSAAQATDGVFSPTQLGMAVARGGGRRQLARGDALMQDLATAGRDIIPSRIGDSGTATRGAITGGVAAMASGVPIANTIAIPVIATSIAYSRPAQSLLNTIYRATDGGSAAAALAELGRFAQRNPALLPYYEAASQHALSLVEPQSQAGPQAPQSPPLAIPGQ